MLRYGKSLGGYTVINVRIEIANSNSNRQKREPSGLTVDRRPGLTDAGREMDETPSAREQPWDKHVSYLCYYRARAT